MPSRLPVVLTLLAALALALAPLLALLRGIPELLGLLRVAFALLAAWGLAREAGWARWLVALLAVLTLWAAWRAYWIPLGLRGLIPDYRLWRAGRVLGGLLLVAAAVKAWESRRPREGAA